MFKDVYVAEQADTVMFRAPLQKWHMQCHNEFMATSYR